MVDVAYISGIQDTASIIRSHNSHLPVQAEVSGRDELAVPADLVPQSDSLVWNVPQPQLAIQGATEKVTVVLPRARQKYWH